MEGQLIDAKHLTLGAGATSIGLPFSAQYADGGYTLWLSPLGLGPASVVSRTAVKIDAETLDVIDVYVPEEREDDPPPLSAGISGSYNLVDRDNNFIVVREKSVEVFGDSVPGDRHSLIELKQRYFLPDEFFCRDGDALVGLVMTYDGRVAFASELGSVGVLPREPELMSDDTLQFVSLNGDACDDPDVPTEDLEFNSNSLSADENGGLYPVTGDAVYRVQLGADGLSIQWRAEYDPGPGNLSAIRLGPGSGSTASLVGTAHDDDHLVAIHDGQEVMHYVLMWRDEIPDDWEPIAPGKDRRIACEVPVKYGDPNTTKTLSEQSILVRGYSAIFFNNLLKDESLLDLVQDPTVKTFVAALLGGNPFIAPRGVERIDWDPETRTCNTVWANPIVSMPNGIPTMSSAANVVYGIENRAGVFGLGGLDFDTGDSVLFRPGAQLPCDPVVLTFLTDPMLQVLLGGLLAQLPGSCENSIFSGATVGPGGAVYTGTLFGLSKYTPDQVIPPSPFAQVVAGVEQGRDLIGRALGALVADELEGAADATSRAVLQLDATLNAIDAAFAAGELSKGDYRLARSKTKLAKAFVSRANGFLQGSVTPLDQHLANVFLKVADKLLRLIEDNL